MSKQKKAMNGGARILERDLSVKYAPAFKIKAVYFAENTPYMYVNMMRYEMAAPSVSRGDNLLVAADCLRTIYSPSMKAEISENRAVLTYRGITVELTKGSYTALRDGEPFSLEAASEPINGHFYLDVESVMEKGFDMTARWEVSYLAPGDYLGIAEDPGELFKTRQVGKDLLVYLHKQKGLLRRAYYFEKGGVIMPYLLYVPFNYDPSVPTKLVVFLHGAGSHVEDSGDLRRRPTVLEMAAERHNMILLLAEGYSMGFYGGGTPALKPERCGEEERYYLRLCQEEVMSALSEVRNEFNIDANNIFITGNSMGGSGSFWLSLQYPEVFRALAPCGALTTTDLGSFDLTPLEGKPLLLVCGSENIGFENVPNQVTYFNAHGVPAQWIGIPGGEHDDAWTYAFEDVLSFFDKHSR